MPRAEKTTKELKKELERITEKYERAVEKENRKIADIVRFHLGDEPDLKRLADALAKVTGKKSPAASSGKESPASKVQSVPKKDQPSSEQTVPADGTAADGE